MNDKKANTEIDYEKPLQVELHRSTINESFGTDIKTKGRQEY